MTKVAVETKTKTTSRVITGTLVIAAIGFAAILAYAAGVVPVEENASSPETIETAAAVTAIEIVGDIYYVDNSISDVNVASSIPDCTDYDPSTYTCGSGTEKVFNSIADVNADRFLPDDGVLFRRGQTWREELRIWRSGTQGHQITYGAFGEGDIKPRITALNEVTEMAPSGSTNVYSKSGIIPAPNVVVINGTMGNRKTSLAALTTNNDWYLAGSTLYVYSDSGSGTLTVEVGARNHVINPTSSGPSYYTIDSLQLDGANNNNAGSGVYVSGNGATGVVISNCEIKHNFFGVLFFTTNAQLGGHTISNSEIHDNRQSGIHANAGSDGSTDSNRTHIYNNQIYNNNGFGILAYASYWLIEGNTLSNNGEHTLPAGWSGIHIWGGPKGSPTAGAGHDNIVRYNVVSGTKSIGEDGNGISADMYADNNLIHHNVVYNNDGPGISLQSNNGNKIYNNTAYGNNQNTGGELAITKLGEIRVTGQPSNNSYPTAQNYSIKNNIAYATAPYAYAISVDRYSYSNNPDITNNVWYAPNVDNWFMWVFHNPSKGLYWNDLSGVGSDKNSNPKFNNAGNLNFNLSRRSPARNAGVDVGLTSDINGTALPQGKGFDIGAYERN